jgi:hypothetical protein
MTERARRSENPFTRAYWLGTVDPRPLAIVRIGLGLAILHDLVDYTRDLRAFITDEGMLPRGAVTDWWTWSVFDWVGSPAAVSVVYALGFAVVVAFTVGFQTRVATVLAWLFLSSLHHRNYYVTDGGDDLARILLFWGMFADLGAAYSLDARKRATRVTDVPAFGLRVMQAQIAMLYFLAARMKIRMGWLKGAAIYETLQLDGFVRPLGAWLGQHPALCKGATLATLFLELVFAFLAYSPWAVKWCRAGTVACGVAVQLGILFTMRVGIFTELTLCAALLWLQPEWIDRLERLARKKEDARPAAVRVASRAWQAVHALVAVQLILAVWDPWVGRRFPLPKVVRDERLAIGIVQPYGLFDVVYDIPRWDAPGKLEDGHDVEVLSVAAPGARPRGAGVFFSRWNKFTFKEREHPFLFAELGAYLCRTYDERTGATLASFTLIDDQTPARAPGAQQEPAKPHVMWEETCPSSSLLK